MSKNHNKCIHKFIKKLGLIIAAVGLGIILTIIIPFWGWLIAIGAALIYYGWYLISNNK